MAKAAALGVAAGILAACQTNTATPVPATIEAGFARRVLIDATNFADFFETFADVYPTEVRDLGGGATEVVVGDGHFQGCPYQPLGPASGNPGCKEPFNDSNGNGRFDGAFLAGFDNGRPAVGVHDPVVVVAGAIRVGTATLGFASIDAVGYHYSEVERIEQDLAARGIVFDALIVQATHNHEAPDLMGQWGPYPSADLQEIPLLSGVHEAYLVHTRTQTADALAEAYSKLEPVELCLAKGSSHRNPVIDAWPAEYLETAMYLSGAGRPDNPASPQIYGWLMEGLEWDSRDPLIINHDLNTWQFRRGDGSVVATVVNTHSHPETRWFGNTYITADYPGYVRERLELEWPGSLGINVIGSVGGLLGPADVPIWQRDAAGNRITEMVNAVAWSEAAGTWVEMRNEAGAPLRFAAPKIAPDNSWEKTIALGYDYAELAIAALSDSSVCFTEGILAAAEERFLMPVYNPLFIAAGWLGLFPRTLYNAAGEPIAAIRSEVLGAFDPDYPDEQLGYVRTKISLARLELGNTDALVIFSAPGELFSEMILGLPEDLDDPAQEHRYWPQGRANHAADFRMRFTFNDLLLQPARPNERVHYMFFGLGNDELGYLVTESDFQEYHPLFDDEPPDHYEESNSVGPRNNEIMEGVYRRLKAALWP